jgi:hypothetical protein
MKILALKGSYNSIQSWVVKICDRDKRKKNLFLEKLFKNDLDIIQRTSNGRAWTRINYKK